MMQTARNTSKRQSLQKKKRTSVQREKRGKEKGELVDLMGRSNLKYTYSQKKEN